MDKLTIEEADRAALMGMGGNTFNNITALAGQLAETMRENERLAATLQYIATGDDTTIDDLHAQYDFYRNKHPTKTLADE